MGQRTSIFKADRPGGVDAFGRAPFARSIAQGIVLGKGQPGIVVGIEGPWGSGKTFVIQQIESVLEEVEPEPLIVQFNPWIISGTYPLVEALLEQIASAVQRNIPLALSKRALKVGEALLSYASVLRHLTPATQLPLPPETGAVVTGASALGQVAYSVTDAKAGKTGEDTTLPQYLKAVDVRQKKVNVAEALAKFSRPVVVIIDDADRLSRDEIRHLVQAIKAVADFDRVSYLVAYDPEVFAQALSNRQEGHRDGYEYLEKVVQIAYPLPILLPWRMRSFVATNVKRTLRESSVTIGKDDEKRFEEAVSFSARLCRHPRDVIRLCNRLRLIQPAVRDELNASDVLVFLAVTLRYPQLSNSMRAYPDDFVHASPHDFERFSAGFYFIQAEARDKSKKDDAKWKKHLPPDADSYLIGALNFLFPAKGGAEDEGLLRIQSWDRFYRLLAFSRAEGVPEISEIASLVNDRAQLSATVGAGGAEAIETLRWVEKYLPEVVIKRIKEPVRALCAGSNDLDAANSESKTISEAIGEVLVALVRTQSSVSIRKELANQVLEEGSLSVSETVVLQAAMDLDKWKMRRTGVPRSKQLLSDSTFVDDLAARWCHKVQEAANSGALLDEVQLGSVLWRWAQLGGDVHAVRSAIRGFCSTLAGLRIFSIPNSLNSRFPIELNAFDLIWDRVEFQKLLESDALCVDKCSTLIERLQDPQVVKYFEARAKEETKQ